jgi:hypothetical protein
MVMEIQYIVNSLAPRHNKMEPLQKLLKNLQK